ncbi:MAG: amino acid ABC transporter substrate-binding protein, partial [Bacteroidetes bacterium]
KETLDPISGKKVHDPETGTYVEVKEFPVGDLDTVLWKDIPVMKYPPITSEGSIESGINPTNVIDVNEIGSEKLSSYNVSLILPFITNQFNEFSPTLNNNSLWAVNFYAGSKMALDVLGEEDIKLNVSVMDSKASASTTSSLIRNSPDLLNANLIIGPYRRDNISQVADFAQRNEIAFVSPHSAASGLTRANSEYIQVNPTLQTHCEAIMQHALENYRPEQLILVSRNNESERSRLKYFYEEYIFEKGVKDTIMLQELIIRDESAGLEEIELMPFINLEDTTVFIVPSWSETFVYSLLRKIDVSKTEFNHIVVYGMPQWMQFEKIDFSYYEKLNVHVTASSFIDPQSTEIAQFKQQFYERYGSIPTLEAYMGYDNLLYFGRMIHKYGTKFQYYLDQEKEGRLLTRYEFEPVVHSDPTTRELSPIERFENKYVNILEFQDFQFKLSE